MPRLAQEGNIRAHTDGTTTELLASMDRAGIAVSVVASIATKPSQAEGILEWSRSLASGVASGVASSRLMPFPSFHPHDPRALERVRAIAAAGFRGVKLHPYYQDFVLDDERLLPVYGEIRDRGLVLLCHTGFDMAFERRRIADPERIARVASLLPDLELVTTHLGAWEDWDEVDSRLIGRRIVMDVAFVSGYLERTRIRSMLMRHPADCLLFGSDSPWADQSEAVADLESLDLPPDLSAAILSGNARRILRGRDG